ncbi:hypothetical protein KWF52_05725 [Acinetobacter pittii]|jgi:hypothetical protein|uniref:Uncharacterized protein n=2 Tax=Acinetobacter TaxID=469 RepID=S3TAU0_9GAMM|nr:MULTISPECIES: hypothetical protein [Acinetobacter]EPG36537.1 hypothetical protein F910_03090 [Acinetobacter baumannii NIPH 410]EPG36754.1 hypothetical protein F907_02451 [Acinetobacter colistiniresistens]EXA89991.1 hypothetical protein J508_1758 [Acinetobacter sp. 1289694]EXH35050.1 hypothetical protein J623_1020 [Acinetobacter sp. 1245249]EYT27847.1 hypothetical protein J622_00763 [Acinetobacter sp. 1564232]
MSKFKKGETSKSVIDKKIEISSSIKRKTELINKIECFEDIPSSLEIKNNTISQTSVHKWNDSEHNIISYSYNTAHAAHNLKYLNDLIDSIKNANHRLSKLSESERKDKGNSTTRISQKEVNKLKIENEELRVALAEVYRAYMSLLDQCREDKEIDAAYRKLILSQAQILGRNRLWLVK